MTALYFAIERWCAWTPDAAPAEVGFLPAMQRRRLGPLAKAVFHTVHQCLAQGEQIPVVFSSVHGESQRTFQILEDLAAGAPVSPAAFSLSVHNAIAGQLSIAFANRAPMLALAPGQLGVVPALIEACGWLAQWPAVVVALYEEPLPEFYRPFTDSPAESISIALRLTAGRTQRLEALPERNDGTPPPLAAVADFLAGNTRSFTAATQPCHWLWSRADG
jgi:hypothetical protein